MADAEIDAAMAELERAYEETIIEFVTEIVALLQEETPFETGHARANWIPSIGREVTREDGAVRETKKKGKFTTAGKAQKAGLAEMLAYRLSMGDAFITNNVPYVQWLNYGTSDQAPANFVETCVDRAIHIVEGRNSGSTFTATHSDEE